MSHYALEIDGGGAWGVGVAKFIYLYEEMTQKKFGDNFIAFSGSSTGAIIAAMLNEGYSGKEIYEMYKSNLSKIFKKFPLYKRTFLKKPKYDNSDLVSLLKEYLKGNMSDFKHPIYIPAANTIGVSKEKVFDLGDKDIPKWLAVVASTSAPTYFEPRKDTNGKMRYLDGSIWCNSPISVMQSGLVGSEYEDGLKILSLGTAGAIAGTGIDNMYILGWAEYLTSQWLCDAGQSQLYMARKNIGYDNVLRIVPLLNKEDQYKMDNISKAKDMENIWERMFLYSKGSVQKFLNS